MTQKLYLEDPARTRFESVVVAHGGQRAVILTRHSRNQNGTAEEGRKTGMIFLPSCLPQRHS